jgi:hypothetical protein
MKVSMRRLLTSYHAVCSSLNASELASAQNGQGANSTRDASRVAAKDTLICVIDRPFQIQRFALRCPEADEVFVQIAD